MMPANSVVKGHNPGFYALRAVDIAYMGISCAKELAAALTTIAELASDDRRVQVDSAKQFAKIKRKARQAFKEAEIHLLMLTSEHEEAQIMRNTLKISPDQGLGLLEAFTAMDPDAKSVFLNMARNYSPPTHTRQPALRLVSSEGRSV